MAKSFREFLKGVLLRGETSDPSDNREGSIWVNSSSTRLKMYLQAAIRTIVSEDQTQTLTNKTLSGNTASNLVNGSGTININSSGTITVPNGTDILVGKATTDTLTNKTIDGDDNTVQDLALTALKTNITDASKFIVRDASGIPVSNTKAVPSGVVVGDTDTQTLTNKTLTSPVINTPTGITKSDVGLGNVDNTSDATKNSAIATLTNKTIDGDDNTVQDLPLTALKTNITDASKFIVRDASGIPVSNTKDVPTGAVVGTSDTQTLSNKTFSDAPILAEIATPSTPSSGFGKIYFKSDGFLYQLNDDGTETKVGAGAGGINYITNSDLESNVTGYVAYADAAGVAPVDGTGGSPTVTATRSTSSPLRGTASLLLTKDAANRQGEGISYDFTIAAADKAKVLQISFEYAIASGTYVDDDVRIYVYDVTNATLIYPAPYLLKNHTLAAEKFGLEFQTSSSSTSYRLIFHVASTSASAYTLKFDTISVGPQAKLYGSPITDWVTTPVPSSAITNLTTDGYQWRRVGDSVEVQFSGTFTGASSLLNLTPAQLLPNGISIDATKIAAFVAGANNDAAPVGMHEALDVTGNGYRGIVTYNKTSNVFNLFNAGTDTALFTPASGDGIAIRIIVPILGWGSQVIMSNDASTRVVAAFYTGTATGTISGADNNVTYGTKTSDTHNAYSSGTYTIPVTGFYNISASVEATATSTTYFLMQIAVNGTIIAKNGYRGVSTSASILPQVNAESIYLRAGDLVTIKSNTNGTGGTYSTDFGGVTTNYFSINQCQGPSQIMASESVSAKYRSTVANNLVTDTIIDFATKDWDSHGAVTTGASWKFTAPISGEYEVNVNYFLAGGTAAAIGNFVGATLRKNGAGSGDFIAGDYVRTTSSITKKFNGSASIKLLAGEYIDLRGYNDTGQTHAAQTTAGLNYIEIKRVGNY